MRLENRTNDVPLEDETPLTKDAAFANDDNRADLTALFRLLLKQPPKDHDVRTCPICKRYGITEI